MLYYIGYTFCFPFLKHDAFRGLSENEVNLYKNMFAPDLLPQTLAIIGCVELEGPHPPVLELQCRVATKVFKVCQQVRRQTVVQLHLRNTLSDTVN